MTDRQVPQPHSDTLEAAKSIMPLLGVGDVTSENKALYLSYRMTGFSVREACKLADIHEYTVRRWRGTSQQEGSKHLADPQFAELEAACSGPDRAKLRKEITHLLFTRNYRLVLERDYEVLMKALGKVEVRTEGGEYVKVPPSVEDHQYLMRARGHYTPQQADIIDRMIDPSESESSKLNITEFIIQMRRKTVEEEIELRVE